MRIILTFVHSQNGVIRVRSITNEVSSPHALTHSSNWMPLPPTCSLYERKSPLAPHLIVVASQLDLLLVVFVCPQLL